MVHKTTILGVLILAFISFGFGLSQSSVKARPTDFDEVDAYINTRMNELGIPGAAVVVVEGNQIVHLQAFGVADADWTPGDTTDTILHRFHRQILYCTRHYAIG